MVWAERAAHELRVPLVRLVDGTGGGGSVKTLETMGFSYVPPLPGFDLVVENLSRVPSSPPRSGRAPGSAPRASSLSHFSVIVRGSAQLFVAGPPVVAAAMGESPDKEELGGARAQTRAGAVDNEAADEDDALGQLRRFLSYLPGSAWEAPPIAACSDPATAARRSCWPSSRASAARPTACAACSSSSSTPARSSSSAPATGARSSPRSRASTGARWASLASDPNHYAGGLTADASDKLARFVDVCDAFRLPVVNFVDQPGFVIGTEAERAGRCAAARGRWPPCTRRARRGARCSCARSTASPARATATARG
jgi:acetyl-CoA carboxylase carboxyltransferase component